ncbi:hypothetical protein [Actinophytocola xanthii]|uniref:Uncharacterized protein n=1 Tax=Actinophytocola xanthii TaxID=1912961 RepID=A0A1Q8CNZ8_9PSEU|nr:hypothetical protein [Actinophytocola xanthii]OLF16082.1 hypothetical protein BU204_18155 [Actinophytocola xanthii]
MLYIVLALVLAAFGLLIAALTTANTLWAWVSVTISVVAAALLIADWVSTRRRPRTPATASAATTRAPAGPPPAEAPAGGPPREPVGAATGEPPGSSTLTAPPPTGLSEDRPPENRSPEDRDAREPVSGPPVAVEPERDVEQTAVHGTPVQPPPPDQEPEEEATDAADLLVVSELTAEVRVVDEHPRYHLGSCRWLATKQTLPLPVNEARQLGFTPCGYCGPDAVLAARHRAAR